MSVLIRNIKMPEDCYECLMCHQRFDGYREETRLACSALEDWAEEEEGRLDNCPLIEVPTPHGRLIDADKLEKGFKRAIGTYLPKDPTRHMNIVDGSECRGWTQALTAVQEAKTVIEAEE